MRTLEQLIRMSIGILKIPGPRGPIYYSLSQPYFFPRAQTKKYPGLFPGVAIKIVFLQLAIEGNGDGEGSY